MGRHDAVTLDVEQQSGEEARTPCSCSCRALDRVGGQLRLDLVPQRLVDDWLVLARVMRALMADLAAVDPVLQHQVQRTPGQRLAAPASAGAARSAFAADARCIELL